jgi:hypothetical protein
MRLQERSSNLDLMFSGYLVDKPKISGSNSNSVNDYFFSNTEIEFLKLNQICGLQLPREPHPSTRY